MIQQQHMTIADIEVARNELRGVLEGLTAEDMDCPLGPGQWRIRDLVAHVNHWNRWGLNRIREAFKRGQTPANQQAIDVDLVNEHVAAAWAQHPLSDVLSEMDLYMEDALAFIHSLSPEQAAMAWDYDAKPLTLRRWFYFAAEHEREHAFEIRVWRAAREQRGD